MAYSINSPDEVLCEGCRQQHLLAQKYLYERYFGRLLGIAMRYTSDREEPIGVLNQAFLKIFTNIGQYSGKGSFSGWMAKVVLHTAIDHARSQATYRRVVDLNSTAEGSTFNEALKHLQAEDLFRLIQRLPPASRTVFSLFVVEGYKHIEIAQMLGIDEGTSKWHLFQARRLLQEMVKKEYRMPVL